MKKMMLFKKIMQLKFPIEYCPGWNERTLKFLSQQMQQDTDNQRTDNRKTPRNTDYQDETEEISNLTNTADVITDAHGHPGAFVAVCFKYKKIRSQYLLDKSSEKKIMNMRHVI